MKRLNLVLQFFSKKGTLLLGIIIGIAIALFIGCTAHAADLSGYEYPVSDGEGVVPCYFADKQEGSNIARQLWYIKFNANAWADREKLRYAVLNVPLPGGMINKTVVSNVVYTCVNTTYRSWVTDNPYQYQVGATGNNALAYAPDSGYMIPYFSNYEKGLAYVNGTLYDGKMVDISECDNWEEYKKFTEGNAEKKFDSSVPVPVNAYVSAITESNVSSIFKYDETELSDFYSEHDTELYYEYSCDYLYQYLTKQQIKNEKHSLSSEFMDGSDSSIDGIGLIRTWGTCKDFYTIAELGKNTPEALSYVLTADSGPYVASDSISLENAVTSSPPNYYDLYSQNVSFFSMEYHMQFIGVQVTIDTYYCDENGQRIYSDSIYFRRFLWKGSDDTYGSTYTRVTHDDDGNDVFHSSYEQDSNGNMTSGVGTLDTGNVLEYIRNGFGLTGKDGYLELVRQTFLGVPAYIWMLIAMAMSVNIIVIVFKVARGF